jgi:hypothetical protein
MPSAADLRHSAASFERTSAQSREHVETLREALLKSQKERRSQSA